MGHELLLETGLCVQLQFLFYFEREIIVSLYKELRKQDLPGVSWLLASLCPSLVLLFLTFLEHIFLPPDHFHNLEDL